MSSSQAWPVFEAEVIPGLAEMARSELRHHFGPSLKIHYNTAPDALRFAFAGPWSRLARVRSVQAIYVSQQFKVPRPKALLGHQNFQQMVALIQAVQAINPRKAFANFKLSAAGSQSSVFQRLITELEQAIGLPHDPNEADLLLRVRPAQKQGWELLIRLGPRPLATRSWRVADFPGALNASVAAAMVQLSQPDPKDRVLNLMCGSATLMIERAQHGRAQTIIGGDWDGTALEAAQNNLQAVRLHLPLFKLQAENTPFPSASFSTILADLPWGQLVGSHQTNAQLYPAFLTEAARLCQPKGRAILITHDIKRLKANLQSHNQFWETLDLLRVDIGSWHPRIFVLRKR